jgi:iron complex outermembrane recepter protein
VSDGLDALIRADYQHSSERTDTVNLAEPSDTINGVNLRLGLEGQSWGAYLSAENLTDNKGAVDVAQAGNLGQARLRPRTIGLNLRYKYQ